ncbi:MAG: RNA methyltransferase, TrmH family group 3 [candidate division WS6 bacterium 34_10]|uniref:RNA methyltransferase, TrmH family group 3 n=1 Tax=candidate division WS6 bacterium 34_10 TaxID=1641389 RepID=A0A101HI25_9BACT|nr:MAG: RNA methyltransferase, TrmH family group 3 [candidate division WS6 bacterium 34_10]
MTQPNIIQIESKNALLELLLDDRDFERIYVASNAFKDQKTREIVKIANEKNIPIIKVPRRVLSRKARTGAESVVGVMVSQNTWGLDELLDKIYQEEKIPFFLILDNIKYTQNIAAIMRTAFAVGVNGIIVPPSHKPLVTDETIRISMGAAERIPLVEMNLFEAVKKLKEEDIKVVGVHMDGQEYFKKNLKGPITFILGAEDVGVSTGMLERVDEKISIPMKEGIGSLNVSVSGAILMYEKLRQEVTS